MAQHDYSIANQTFPNTRQDLNNSLSAIVSNNSGATEPSTTYAYQWWYDETTDTLKMRNSDNDAWISMFTFDQTGDTYSLATDVELTITENLDLTGSATISGDLTVDTDTLYVDSSNNRVGVKNASPTVELDVTGEAKISGDLTVDTDVFFVDTSPDRVGVGTNSPARRFHIHESSASTASHLVMTTANTGLTTGDGFNLSVDGTSSNVNFIQRENADMVFYTNGGANERMRIDSSGNVGIGESSPLGKVHINTGGSATTINTNGDDLILETDGNTGMSIIASNTSDASIYFRDPDDTNIGAIQYSNTNDYMAFRINDSERMRIDSSGNVLVGKSTTALTTEGLLIGSNGRLDAVRDGGYVGYFNRLTNDGDILLFAQNTTTEGSISVSGSTVSYNGFTGTHWSRLIDNSKPTILRGTILESLDEMMDWYQVQFDITDEEGTTTTHKESYALGDGESVGDVITYTYEGTDYQATIIQEGDVKHTKSKISDTVDAKNVYGVFMDWDNDDDTVNDMYVAQTGTFVVRINGSETVSKGDLIQSNGDGTGKVQADDLLRASTVAKVLSTTKIETYDDGSYIVPCSLHC